MTLLLLLPPENILCHGHKIGFKIYPYLDILTILGPMIDLPTLISKFLWRLVMIFFITNYICKHMPFKVNYFYSSSGRYLVTASCQNRRNQFSNHLIELRHLNCYFTKIVLPLQQPTMLLVTLYTPLQNIICALIMTSLPNYLQYQTVDSESHIAHLTYTGAHTL